MKRKNIHNYLVDSVINITEPFISKLIIFSKEIELERVLTKHELKELVHQFLSLRLIITEQTSTAEIRERFLNTFPEEKRDNLRNKWNGIFVSDRV